MVSPEEKRAKKLEYMREWRRRKIASDPHFLERESARTALHHAMYPDRAKAARDRRLERDPEYERRYMREYNEENRSAHRDRSRRSNRKRAAQIRAYLNTPEQLPKQRARFALNAAVRAGIVVKPDRCGECGTVTPKRRLHGHHTDYDKPFIVEWLCSTCHGKRHRK